MNVQNKFSYLLTVVVVTLSVLSVCTAWYFFLYQVSSSQVLSEIVENKIVIESASSLDTEEQEENISSVLSNFPDEDTEEYVGPVRHIFFHSLIIYPEQARADIVNFDGYKDNMVTVQQFKEILQQLYENKFILIDAKILYSTDEDDTIHQNKLYLPKGKKPLILSIDDLSYYSYMKNGGFAQKLVLENDRVKTEVVTPEGDTIVTNDGDVVPIVDAFVKEHPDFSLDGAKGIIGVTGFEGILGYHTQLPREPGDREREAAQIVVDALKKSGWVFANHSFGHEQVFLKGTISSSFLAQDLARWATQVEPLVGSTTIFIGPFGQVFKEGDVRRKQLIDAGFTVLYGVGMDGYTNFFNNYFVMNRTNIDGYRLRNNAKKLYQLFGISVTVDTDF